MYYSFILKIIPVYLVILIGWLGAKKFEVANDAIPKILLLLITPVVFFGSISQLSFTPILIPFIAFSWIPNTLSSAIAGRIFSRYLTGADSKVISSAGSMSNSGYFGIPLYISLYGEKNLGIWMLMAAGATLFECTVSYYQLARSNFSVEQSRKKLLTLPVLWSVVLGLAFAAAKISIPKILMDMHREFRGAYMVFGMLIIGISLARMEIKCSLNRTLLFGIAARLFIFPICMVGVVSTDEMFFHFLTLEMRQVALLFGVLPVAANLIVYCSQFDISTELPGSIVFATLLISTLIAPIMVIFSK